MSILCLLTTGSPLAYLYLCLCKSGTCILFKTVVKKLFFTTTLKVILNVDSFLYKSEMLSVYHRYHISKCNHIRKNKTQVLLQGNIYIISNC